MYYNAIVLRISERDVQRVDTTTMIDVACYCWFIGKISTLQDDRDPSVLGTWCVVHAMVLGVEALGIYRLEVLSLSLNCVFVPCYFLPLLLLLALLSVSLSFSFSFLCFSHYFARPPYVHLCL